MYIGVVCIKDVFFIAHTTRLKSHSCTRIKLHICTLCTLRSTFCARTLCVLFVCMLCVHHMGTLNDARIVFYFVISLCVVCVYVVRTSNAYIVRCMHCVQCVCACVCVCAVKLKPPINVRVIRCLAVTPPVYSARSYFWLSLSQLCALPTRFLCLPLLFLHSHAHQHACIFTYICMHTHTRMHMHMHTHMHTHTRTHACTRTHTCTHIHTRMRTHTHTHIHTHSHAHQHRVGPRAAGGAAGGAAAPRGRTAEREERQARAG